MWINSVQNSVYFLIEFIDTHKACCSLQFFMCSLFSQWCEFQHYFVDSAMLRATVLLSVVLKRTIVTATTAVASLCAMHYILFSDILAYAVAPSVLLYSFTVIWISNLGTFVTLIARTIHFLYASNYVVYSTDGCPSADPSRFCSRHMSRARLADWRLPALRHSVNTPMASRSVSEPG